MCANVFTCVFLCTENILDDKQGFSRDYQELVRVMVELIFHFGFTFHLDLT